MSSPSFFRIKQDIADLIDDRIDAVVEAILTDEDFRAFITPGNLNMMTFLVREIVYEKCLEYREQIGEGPE